MQNPYAPPVATLDLLPAPTGPRTPTSVPASCGILSIVFGAVTLPVPLSWMAFGILQITHGEDRLVVGGIVFVCSGLIGLVMSGSLVFLGVGQRRCRAWARTGTLAWAIGALCELLLLIVGTLFNAIRAESNSLATLAPGLLLLLVLAPYPIILLVLFTRARVVAAMEQ